MDLGRYTEHSKFFLVFLGSSSQMTGQYLNHGMAASVHIYPIPNTSSIQPFESIVACRRVAKQRPRNKQLHNSRY
jgi:hypothetical protein